MPKCSSWGTKRRLSDAQKAHLARLPTHLPRVSCDSHRHPSEAVQEPAFVANNTQEPARKVHTDTKIRNIRRRERWAKSRALMLDTKIRVLTVTAQKERCDLELKLKSALADSQASQAVLFLAETQNDQLKSLLDASETRVLHLEDMLALNLSQMKTKDLLVAEKSSVIQQKVALIQRLQSRMRILERRGDALCKRVAR